MSTLSGIALRPATADDAPAISAVALSAIRTTNARDYAPAAIDEICSNFTIDKVLERMQSRDVFVALSDGRIVGTISLGGDKLHSLFVDPISQGHGIGLMLVTFLEAHARTKGLTRLWLSSSITARLFYQKLGYSEMNAPETKAFSTIPMQKTIADPLT